MARQLGVLMKVLKPSELSALTFDDLALGCLQKTQLDIQVTDIQVRRHRDSVIHLPQHFTGLLIGASCKFSSKSPC